MIRHNDEPFLQRRSCTRHTSDYVGSWERVARGGIASGAEEGSDAGGEHIWECGELGELCKPVLLAAGIWSLKIDLLLGWKGYILTSFNDYWGLWRGVR